MNYQIISSSEFLMFSLGLPLLNFLKCFQTRGPTLEFYSKITLARVQ